MSVLFLQDTDWRPASMPIWGGGEYDLDTCRIQYRGKVTTKAAFIETLAKFHALPAWSDARWPDYKWPAYPRMFFTTLSDDGGPHFPTVELSYTGIGIRNSLPPEKPENSLALKPVSVDGLSGAGLDPITFTGQYSAPRTKWTWYQSDRPVSPKFTTINGGVGPSLVSAYAPGGTPIPLATAGKYLAFLKTKATVADFQTTEIAPNAMWQCSCVVDLDFTL